MAISVMEKSDFLPRDAMHDGATFSYQHSHFSPHLLVALPF